MCHSPLPVCAPHTHTHTQRQRSILFVLCLLSVEGVPWHACVCLYLKKKEGRIHMRFPAHPRETQGKGFHSFLFPSLSPPPPSTCVHHHHYHHKRRRRRATRHLFSFPLIGGGKQWHKKKNCLGARVHDRTCTYEGHIPWHTV